MTAFSWATGNVSCDWDGSYLTCDGEPCFSGYMLRTGVVASSVSPDGYEQVNGPLARVGAEGAWHCGDCNVYIYPEHGVFNCSTGDGVVPGGVTPTGNGGGNSGGGGTGCTGGRVWNGANCVFTSCELGYLFGGECYENCPEGYLGLSGSCVEIPDVWVTAINISPDCQNLPDTVSASTRVLREQVSIFCNGSVPQGGQLTAIQGAIGRIRAHGGVCAAIANSLDSSLSKGNLKLFNPAAQSALTNQKGGWSLDNGGSNGWMALSVNWLGYGLGTHDNGVPPMNLSSMLVHEGDHTNGNFFTGSQYHDPNNTRVTVNMTACDDIP